MRYLLASLLTLVILATLLPQHATAQAQQESVPITFTEHTQEYIDSEPFVTLTCEWELVGSHADPVGNGQYADYEYPLGVYGGRYDPHEWTGLHDDIPGQRLSFWVANTIDSYFESEFPIDCDYSEEREWMAEFLASYDANAYYAPPPNEPPTACFTVEEAEEVLTMNFDASCSGDSDGQVVSYDWDFGGDGTDGGGGAQTSFTYDRRGTYTVTLTVRDDDGDEDTASETVEVEGLMRYELTLARFTEMASKRQANDTTTVQVGDSVGVTIMVENTGDLPLEEIQVTDGEAGINVPGIDMPGDPAALEFVRAEPAEIDRLEPGETDSLLYVYKAVHEVETTNVEVMSVSAQAVHENGDTSAFAETIDGCDISGKSGLLALQEDSDGCELIAIEAAPLLVNSTGDDPLDDGLNPEEGGCSTGGSVVRDGEPETECTLRAAIEAANAAGKEDAAIHFNIPAEDAGCSSDFGCAIIVQTALPSIDRVTIIDATTQPGYVVENPGQAPLITLAGNGGVESGLRLLSDNSEIKGLQINAFTKAGIEIQGSGSKVIHSAIGNNGVGVLITGGDGNEIGDEETGEHSGEPSCLPNVIGGNSEAGIKIEQGSSANLIQCNVIGLLPGVSVSGPNGVGLLIEDSPANYVNSNVIAGNTGVGVHIVGAGAPGNFLKANRIGGFPSLGTEGNAWGVVIESASGTSLGSEMTSGRFDYNVISSNTSGNVLIFSEDPQAPANNNTVQHTGIGTDLNLHATIGNGRFGLVISGSASNNTIGPYIEGEYSVVIGQHSDADLAVYTPAAVGNQILSGLIGLGLEWFEGGSQVVGFSDTNIDVRGAHDTQIGTMTSGGAPSIILGNTHGTAINIEGTDERRVTLEGLNVSIRDITGTGTSVQSVDIELSSGGLVSRPVGRAGIAVDDTRDVQIGPQVNIDVCQRFGILIRFSEDNTVTGTQLRLFDHKECTFGDPKGISISSSSRNTIGTLDPSGQGNTFDGLPLGVSIQKFGSDAASVENQIVGNTFGAQKTNEVGILLGRGVSGTTIGGSTEGGNQFVANETGILLSGATNAAEFPTGTVIEGNTFEGSMDALGGTAIEVQKAFHTRIGGTTQSGSVGGNMIRNYQRGVVVQRPAEQDEGTVILGNAIYDTQEHGIIGWDSFPDRLQDLFRLPVANISATETSLLGSGIAAKGKVAGWPDRLMIIQYFRSDACHGINEGRDYLTQETVVTDALGGASFEEEVAIEEGDGLTVTATDLTDQRTSEFSLCYTHGADGQSTEVAFDAGAGDTIVDEAGVVARVASVGKTSVTDTLYVTAYPTSPAGDRFTGEAAPSASGQMILPRSATGRYWRIETAGPADAFTLDLCFDASGFSGGEAMETVLIQRSMASVGRWVPHETHVETHGSTLYACTNDIVPTGEFGFGSGSEAVLAAPALLLPENDATDILLGSVLSWQTLPDAVRYDVQVALDPGFVSLLADTTGLASAAFTPDSLVANQVHYWRVRGITGSGEAGPWSAPFRFATDATSVAVEDEVSVPGAFVLEGNYPNPFNPQTTIGFALPQAAEVRLVVYDVLGREVVRLVEGTLAAGRHEAVFDASGLPTGIYLYRLQADGFAQTRRMLLVK